MQENDRGFYKCKKCNILIRVDTHSITPYGRLPLLIRKCPQCYGIIEKITKQYFDDAVSCMFINIKRTYYSKSIRMGLKFL